MAAGVLFGSMAAASATTSPNILVFVGDDVGVDKIGAFARDYPGYVGATHYMPATPIVDELAYAGLRFTNTWGSPLCSPTRSELLTGRMGWRTGVGTTIPDGPELDPDAETTLADVLKDPTTGDVYATAAIGKWHLGTATDPVSYTWGLESWDYGYREVPAAAHPIRAGFDFYAGNTDGEVENYYNWTKTYADSPDLAILQTETEWAGDETVTDALDWINAQTGPWFAYVPFNAAHTSATTSSYSYAELSPDCHQVACLLDGTCTTEGRAVYAGLVECMDRGIGDILEGMDPAVLDETIIVFLGDNGTPFSVEEADFADRGARSSNGKGSIYETGIRVPMTITSGKNWREYHDCTMLGRARDVCVLSEGRVRRPGRVVPSPLMVTDLFDTLARLGGRSPTTGDDSYSFAGCLQNPGRGCGGPATSPSRVVYAERFEYTTDATTGIDELSFGSAAIRQGSTKLTAELDASRGCFRYGLFDLSADPFERTSRAFTDPTTLASMMTTLSAMAVPWQAGIPICH